MVILLLLALKLGAAVTSVVVEYDDPSGEVSGQQRGVQPFGGRLVITTAAGGDTWSIAKGTCTSFWVKQTSGTGTTTVPFGWSMTQRTIPAGQNSAAVSCTGSAGGVNFTVNGRTYRIRRPLFVTSYLGQSDGAWSGCDSLTFSGSVQIDQYRQNCTSTSSHPPSDGVSLPAVCATWTDSKFGGVWKRLAATSKRPYSSTQYSRDGRYLFIDAGLIDTTNCSLITPPWGGGSPICSGSGIGSVLWDYTDKAGYSGWCFVGATKTLIKRWTFNGSTFSDAGTIYTHGVNIGHDDGMNTGNGGTGTYVSADGWVPFHDANNLLWLLNLKDPTQKYSIARPYVPRALQIAPYPDAAGNRVFHTVGTFLPPGNAEAATYFYLPPNGTALVQGADIARADQGIADAGVSYNRACTPYVDTSCIGAGHNSALWLEGAVGRIGASNGSPQVPFLYQQTLVLWMHGRDAARSMDIGGGEISTLPHGVDHYAVAAIDAPIIVFTGDPYNDQNRGVTCTGDGTTVTCTVSAPSNPDGAPNLPGTNVYTVSQRVLLNGFSQSAWNGYKTVATSSGSTITITNAGTGTSLAGYITPASTENTAVSNRSHIVAMRADNGHACILSKMHPSMNASYSQLSLPSVSPDGSKVAINSGFGFPGELGTWEMKTCFQGWRRGMRRNDFVVNEPGALYGLRVLPETGQLRVRVSTPLVNGACEIGYSSTWDYASATTQTLAAGTKAREYVISGLSAGQARYVYAVCDGLDADGVQKARWLYAIDEGAAK